MDVGARYHGSSGKKRKISSHTITILCTFFWFSTSVDARSPFYNNNNNKNLSLTGSRAFYSLSNNYSVKGSNELWGTMTGQKQHEQFLLNELDNERSSNFIMINSSITETSTTTTTYSVINSTTTGDDDDDSGNDGELLEINLGGLKGIIDAPPSSTIKSSIETAITTTTATASTTTTSINGSEKKMKKTLTNKSNRSRVNNVFELSSKMVLNSTINRNYKTARANKVTLLGLFELSTKNGIRPEGQSELASARLAIMHVNREKLLGDYVLELITNDTQGDPGVGVDRFFHAIYTNHMTRMVMLLGTAFSEVTESLAKIVPYWNIVQVSGSGAKSPALSDRMEFPLFYRTVAPDSSHNPALITFIRKFGWDTLTTFSQNEEIYSLAVNNLVTELENANISTNIITFAETDLKDQLQLLRDLDTRIIIGSFSEDVAHKVFCEAFKLGMFGADYAWILQEDLGSKWWLRENDIYDCTIKQLQAVAENMIIVSSHKSIVDDDSPSGMNKSTFFAELKKMKVPEPYSRYAPHTYDAILAIAKVLRGAEETWNRAGDRKHQPKLDEFDYTRYDMASEFLYQFSQLNFLGLSGPVSFDGADRVGYSAFYQIQNSETRHICLYYPETELLDFTCSECIQVQWHKGQVPIAKRILKLRVATIDRNAFYVICTVAFLGVTLALSLMAFNLYYRKLKTIKLSSPSLSNITIVGCILVYAAVILLGLDYSTLPATDSTFPVVCMARVSLLSAGFSLAFGSMFAKTYRVHRIFTYSGIGLCKNKILQDSKLILLVCALLVIDGLVVTLWVITDPLDRHLSNLTLEISATDRSVVYQPQVEVCRSHHTTKWLGILYFYKGLLLVVGVYMAWETRHVKIPALNDSQYIGISVYSVVITSASVVVLANLLSERVTLAYLIATTFILLSTTATLCLLFLPKINDIWNRDKMHDPVVHSLGLKVEYNTRRFVIEDSKEIHYRVEVQNRVYKKEVAELDVEIQKLEKLLDHSSASSSTASVSVAAALHRLSETKTKGDVDQQGGKSRQPSITGGLPLLLLSVLPPVIPRASWPSADHMSMTIRRSVTFSSEPHMEDGDTRLPAIDLLNLRLRHQKCMENRTLFDKIKGMFGSRAPSRKESTSSIGGSGIAAAFKAHMGLISGLVPNSASSCHTLNVNSVDTKVLRRPSLAKSGTAINIEITEPEFEGIRAFSICSSNSSFEPRVNFNLPINRRPSTIPNVAPTLRERIRGSPRFPHRILPTSSLNTLVDDAKHNGQRRSSKHFATKIKWKSMEDSSVPIPILKVPKIRAISFDQHQTEAVAQDEVNSNLSNVDNSGADRNSIEKY